MWLQMTLFHSFHGSIELNAKGIRKPQGEESGNPDSGAGGLPREGTSGWSPEEQVRTPGGTEDVPDGSHQQVLSA